MNYFNRVRHWMLLTFGPDISNDLDERRHRFFEEATELVQAIGGTREECYQLVDYVFDRPVGEPFQEIGGVMVTLNALCHPLLLDPMTCGEIELARCHQMMDKIREKQKTKPPSSPLPA